MNEKLTVLLVQPEKVPERIEIDNGLEALQKVVGGYIEAVYPYEDPVALIVNDEGKLNGLPLNRALRDGDGQIYDVIAGPFLVVGLGGTDFISLNSEQQKKYEMLFHRPEAFVRVNGQLVVIPAPVPKREPKHKQRGEAR